MTIKVKEQQTNKIFQLTSSRRGWHRKLPHLHSNPDISTHILTKRMTRFLNTTSCAYNISTHILTKRMTDILKNSGYNSVFQLTSSRRGWRDLPCQPGQRTNISTHILTKRMTLLGTEGSIMNYISTHILTKRMTVLLAMIYALQKLISTHILTKRMTASKMWKQ